MFANLIKLCYSARLIFYNGDKCFVILSSLCDSCPYIYLLSHFYFVSVMDLIFFIKTRKNDNIIKLKQKKWLNCNHRYELKYMQKYLNSHGIDKRLSKHWQTSMYYLILTFRIVSKNRKSRWHFENADSRLVPIELSLYRNLNYKLQLENKHFWMQKEPHAYTYTSQCRALTIIHCGCQDECRACQAIQKLIKNRESQNSRANTH